MIELLVVLATITVLASIVLTGSLYAFDASKLGKTVAEIRTVSEAVLEYERDHGRSPESGGPVPVMQVVEALRASVDGPVPTRDGWGHPLYYESIVDDNGVPSFRLYSYGKDGVPDGLITGNYDGFHTDVVLEGGTFIQTKW